METVLKLTEKRMELKIRGVGGDTYDNTESHRRHCVVSLSKNINPSLVLVQPRKTRPFITERLLMGRKESNQTNKTKTTLRVHKQYKNSQLIENNNANSVKEKS